MALSTNFHQGARYQRFIRSPIGFYEMIIISVTWQRNRLHALAQSHDYNFTHPDVVAASVQLDSALNLYNRHVAHKNAAVMSIEALIDKLVSDSNSAEDTLITLEALEEQLIDNGNILDAQKVKAFTEDWKDIIS
ncbi:MAG: hypothetical protein JWM44_2062 [Bacilli bacterium]|nr:hypothetical protein [Bacilli bacterium]